MGCLLPTLSPLLAKMEVRTGLGQDDRDAVLGLPFMMRKLGAGANIVRAGQETASCYALLAGFAYRHNIVKDGSRQILGINLPGDLIDLQFAMLRPADNNVQALTAVEIAVIPLSAAIRLMRSRPAIAEAIWSDMLADMSVFKEWIANVGRRDARARIAHIICELAVRQAAIGYGQGEGKGRGAGQADRCVLPMTQEQLADTLGLTAVHINRTLRRMDSEGLIKRGRRVVYIPDWNALAQAGDFSETYLHLPQRTVRDRVATTLPNRQYGPTRHAEGAVRAWR